MKLFLRLCVLAPGLLSACDHVAAEPEDGGGPAVAAHSEEISTACEEWCKSYTAQCDYIGSCTDHCREHATYLAPCAAEYESLVRCEAALEWLDTPDCTATRTGNACEAALDTLLACVYPTGECEAECVAGGHGVAMECTYLCGGVRHVALCDKSPSTGTFPMDCVCQIDGETVGDCQNVTADGSAGLGCCSSYFAEGA